MGREKRLEEVRSEASARFLEALRYVRIVNTDLFAAAYTTATPEDKILLGKPGPHVSKILKKDLDNQPITALRKLGQKYKVKDYHSLPKAVLVEEIKDAIRKTENITSGHETVR